jgi:hypothetical protein
MVIKISDVLVISKKMAGKEGIEPTTNRLTVYCATTAPLPNKTELSLQVIKIKGLNV